MRGVIGTVVRSEPVSRWLPRYQAIVDRIWLQLERPLGPATVHILFERALAECVRTYPAIRSLRPEPDRFSLDPLGPAFASLVSATRDSSADADQDGREPGDASAHRKTATTRETAVGEAPADAVDALLVSVVEMLAVLTGDVITRRLLPDLVSQEQTGAGPSAAGSERAPTGESD